MASSNQGDSEPKPPQLATHNSDTCAANHASPSPSPPPPTANYGTYLPFTSVYPSHVLGKGSPTGKDSNNVLGEGIPTEKDSENEHETCYTATATGYPSVLDKDYNPHVYPQGHAVYADGYPTGYQVARPTMAPSYGPPPTHHRLTSKDKILRFTILCCCVLLASIFIASLLIGINDKPPLPIYKVMSMSVANFAITPSLSGQWDIKLVIENPSDDSDVSFCNFKVSLMYKGDPLVTNRYHDEDGFELYGKEDLEIQVKYWSGYASHDVIEKDEMVKERSSGAITFDLRISSRTILKTNLFSSTKVGIVGSCTGLKVVFQSNTTNGAWDNGGKPMECRLRV